MELITLLNRCHRFRGFVYEHARLSADKKSIEVVVGPCKGSAAVCSRCHLPAPGYDQLAERRFEFIPLWGFFVFLLYAMRRVDCRSCGVVAVEEVRWSDGKRTLTKAYMLFLTRWARRLSWRLSRFSHLKSVTSGRPLAVGDRFRAGLATNEGLGGSPDYHHEEEDTCLWRSGHWFGKHTPDLLSCGDAFNFLLGSLVDSLRDRS